MSPYLAKVLIGVALFLGGWIAMMICFARYFSGLARVSDALSRVPAEMLARYDWPSGPLFAVTSIGRGLGLRGAWRDGRKRRRAVARIFYWGLPMGLSPSSDTLQAVRQFRRAAVAGTLLPFVLLAAAVWAYTHDFSAALGLLVFGALLNLGFGVLYAVLCRAWPWGDS